ncbi:hypothetical protein A5625_18660 [Mycobacterium sp. 1465703.0]|nr:hypothetical protein A5625_18660 [Mycobacterium sp. 1465703.0]
MFQGQRGRQAAPEIEEIAPTEGRLERLRGRLARSQNALGRSMLGLIGGGAVTVSGSGSSTSEMVRRGASWGMVASSPTAGSPVVSSRSAVAVWLKVMPEDAV